MWRHRSHTPLHTVLTEQSSADTQELGYQTGGSQVETGAPGEGRGAGLGKWLTVLPGGAWGLGLHVSLV